MERNKGFRFAGMLAAALAFALVFAGCKSGGDDDEDITPSADLSFDTISRLAYMGGSLMYNPNGSVAGQLAKGVAVATRFATVKYDAAAATPDKAYTKTNDVFGYIIVSDVNANSITLSYHEYSDTGEDHSKGRFTVGLDEEVDITGDGKADVTYSAPAYKRDGMESAVWLTFISPQPDASSVGNTSMYSVLAEQYARAAYPNGVMGITPDGRFVVNMYESGGARAAVRGVEYGDIVVDGKDGKYSNIKSGTAFRSVAQRIGDDPAVLENVGDGTSWSETPENNIAELDSIPEGTNVYNTATISGGGTAEVSGSEQLFQEDQFNNYATPEKLWNALPASITSGVSGDYIIKLNQVLNKDVSVVVDAVVAQITVNTSVSRSRFARSARAVSGNKISLDDFVAGANQLKTDAASFTTTVERISALRSFLNAAYPEFCPLASAQSVTEMFPIVSVNYSAPNAMENIAASVAAAQRAIDSSVAQQGLDSRGVITSFNTYDSEKSRITKEFYEGFTELGPFELNNLSPAHLGKASIIAQLGLYGSFECYWGKIGAGIGIGLLFNAEIEGPKASFSENITRPITLASVDIMAGPVLLTISASVDPGLELNMDFPSENLFAGFIAVVGTKFGVGADYGIRQNHWWEWPSAYFNPYAWGEKIAQSAFYAGPKSNLPLNVAGKITVKPFVSFGPSVSVYKCLSAGLSCEHGFPLTWTFYKNNSPSTFKGEYAGVIKASAGVGIDFCGFHYGKDFATWTIASFRTQL